MIINSFRHERIIRRVSLKKPKVGEIGEYCGTQGGYARAREHGMLIFCYLPRLSPAPREAILESGTFLRLCVFTAVFYGIVSLRCGADAFGCIASFIVNFCGRGKSRRCQRCYPYYLVIDLAKLFFFSRYSERFTFLDWGRFD